MGTLTRAGLIVVAASYIGLAQAGGEALDTRWEFELGAGARGLPLVMNVLGEPSLEILVTSRFNGTLWTVGADGKLIGAVRRDNWLEGPPAAAVHSALERPRIAFIESNGNFNISDSGLGVPIDWPAPGAPALGSGPVTGDIDGDTLPEIAFVNRNGLLTVTSITMLPLWQYDAGEPVDAPPVLAPVFVGLGSVYIVSLDGTLHCIAGNGRPLWQFSMSHRAAAFPSLSDFLVLQLGGGNPAVLCSDALGWLYCVDAATGHERWRVQAGTAALGTPAIADADSSPGKEIITLSEKGEIALIDGNGYIIGRASLPEGRYVPRPLLADVDGDQTLELLAASDWKILVASLDGAVEQVAPLRGTAHEGLVLADIDRDGLLELFAATDCAQLVCLNTRALAGTGWTHPRGGPAMNGYIGPTRAVDAAPPEPVSRRSAVPDSVAVAENNNAPSFATASLYFDRPRGKQKVSAIIRSDGVIVGSATKRVGEDPVTVPLVRNVRGVLTADLVLFNEAGTIAGVSQNVPVSGAAPKPIRLGSGDAFLAAIDRLASDYEPPPAWAVPKVHGKDSWNVISYMPGRWAQFGLALEPFIDEAVRRVRTSAAVPESVFQPGHPAWDNIMADVKPFFVMNDYFWPEVQYPAEAHRAIVAAAPDRFLGYPVHEWGYRIWKEKLEAATTPPNSRKAATAVVKKEFDQLMQQTYGRIYAGEGYCLFHHQAFEWGAPLAYIEMGENIPLAPLQFAAIRGASRQYEGRPWGAYVSNWFRGAVLDTRWQAHQDGVSWSPPDVATGTDAGHSASLEFRLEMAAHLAGATFVHHESEEFHGSVFVEERAPDEYSLSSHGAAFKTWYDYAGNFPERGIPYAPVAFMLDFDHGWRPRQKVYGIWPQDRAAQCLEQMFRHVYNWDGRLDFERGYLTSGSYGDIFDVLTQNAPGQALGGYGVVWPLGDVELTTAQRDGLMDYVGKGGILVLDASLAENFPGSFLGTDFDNKLRLGSQFQTALRSIPTPIAPFRYNALRPRRDTEVLAWTEDGRPVLGWQRYGAGIVVAGGIDRWLDERGNLLPIVDAIMGPISEAFLPMRVSTDVEVMVNRTERGWIVGVINNHGITKVPIQPAELDLSETRECVLRFKAGAPLRFESRLGEFRWSNPAGGLMTQVAPGSVAVVEVIYSDR